MSLKHKIDFFAIVAVNMANPNGDPLNGNRPRTNYDGKGEISDVCIKRKMRNRMQDMGQAIFVQSEDRCEDAYKSLSERAAKSLDKIADMREYARAACEKWLDVRTFGQVFAFKKGKKAEGDDGVSVGVRGPVSLHQAISVNPIDVESFKITKSVNGDPAEGRSSDTMGDKHFVRFGVYELKGSINVQLADKTGFTDEDAAIVKECLRTLFVNDISAARPDGSMQVCKLFWWEHDCAIGQYPAAKVHGSVKVMLPDKAGAEVLQNIDAYITRQELPGLRCEVLEGI